MNRHLNPPQKGDVEVTISHNFCKQFDTFDYVVNGKKESIIKIKEITTTIQKDFIGEGEYLVIINFQGTIKDKINNGYKEDVQFNVSCQVSVIYQKVQGNQGNEPLDLIEIIVNFIDKPLLFTTVHIAQ